MMFCLVPSKHPFIQLCVWLCVCACACVHHVHKHSMSWLNLVLNPVKPQIVDNSPIEVTLAKPVDKDSYVRYTRGTGGRGAALLQGEYTYTLGQVYDPSAAYLGAPVFYAPHAYATIPNQFRFPSAKGHVGTRGLVRTPSVRGGWGVCVFQVGGCDNYWNERITSTFPFNQLVNLNLIRI